MPTTMEMLKSHMKNKPKSDEGDGKVNLASLAKELGEDKPAADEKQPEPAPEMTWEKLNGLKTTGVEAAYANSGKVIAGWAEMALPAKKAALALAYGFSVPDKAEAKSEGTEAASQPAESKEVATTKPKGKATKKGEQTILPPDLISDTAHEVENVKEQDDAHQRIKELAEVTGVNEFKLGAYLSLVQEKGWFGTKANLREFAESIDVDYRKATYLISIYRGLVDADVPWAAVANIGWTKLKDLVGVINKDNVEKWAQLAATMSANQLLEHVKAAKAEAAGDGKPGEAAVPQVTTMQFKVHSDQKENIQAAIDKAKKMGNTDVAAVALDLIATDFLAGPQKKAAKPPSKEMVLEAVNTMVAAGDLKKLFETMRDADPEDQTVGIGKIMEAFEAVFPNIDVTLDVKETEKAA